MANLLSTAPLAFNTIYNLITAAANTQSPVVQVFHTAVFQNEPASYVLLEKIENHHFDWDSLGTFAFTEEYSIIGEATYYTGQSGAAATQDTITSAYALFQSLVQSTMVQNRNPPISAALQSAGVIHIIPGYARYTGEPGIAEGGAAMGFFGTVNWSYTIKARVTVT